MSEKAIFLDKDGTLVQDVPYNVDPAKIRLMPGAVEGLPRQRTLYSTVTDTSELELVPF